MSVCVLANNDCFNLYDDDRNNVYFGTRGQVYLKPGRSLKPNDMVMADYGWHLNKWIDARNGKQIV